MGHDPISSHIEKTARQIVDAAYTVHSSLGPGLLESVYQACMESELTHRGIFFRRQVGLPVVYRDIKLDAGLRLDLLVENDIVLELKSVEAIHPIHVAQVLTYLKLSERRLALLINFNVVLIKEGIRRTVL